MSVYSKILGINPEDTENVAAAYEGYAGFLSTRLNNQESDNEIIPWIASSYILAASLRAILNPIKSSTIFRSATAFYQRAQNPYWKIAAICSNDKHALRYSAIEDNNTLFSPDIFYDLLAKIMIENDTYMIFRAGDRWGQQPVGRLAIPLNYFIAAAIEIIEKQHNGDMNNVKRFLNRGAENSSILRNDSYHWSNFMGTFLPVEPEMLAACICLLKLNKQKISLLELISREENTIAWVPLRMATEIVANTETNDDNPLPAFA